MFDISTNSIGPIKRQEKELNIFYDSTDDGSDVNKIDDVLGEFNENSGI